MTLSEKKQIYLDRFPSIIGRRMSEQISENTQLIWAVNLKDPSALITCFNYWRNTNEGYNFWSDFDVLYENNETVEHQQILDIFHKHSIKP